MHLEPTYLVSSCYHLAIPNLSRILKVTFTDFSVSLVFCELLINVKSLIYAFVILKKRIVILQTLSYS